MALRLKKDIKKASYYVWFLGAQESRGLRGEEYAVPAIRILEARASELEPFKVTLQVSHKGLKIIQNVTAKGKQQTIKHFIPHGSITSAVVQSDVVACVLLLYNPLTGCPVHVHAYRCDSDHTAEMLYTHLQALIERPENQKKFADIEKKLQLRGALPVSKKPPDSSLGSEVSRESDSGSNEERCVANLYDSLAAELKQKLSTGKSPILLPPRDYDTVHRQKGNLSNIDTRRCLNQSIVGVNARRKLESSGGSSGIGSDLAPSPERNEYTRQHDAHSTSEEDWAESTAYMMHDAFEVAPSRRSASPPPRRGSLSRRTSPRRGPSPRRASPPRRAASPPRRVASPPRRVSSPPRRVASPPRRVSPPRRAASPPRRAISPYREPYSDDFPDREFRDQLAPFREQAFARYRHESLERAAKEKSDKYTDGYRRRFVAEPKPSSRVLDRPEERRFGKLVRGVSEGSLMAEVVSPKDRFVTAKEKFMNLERERFTRELEQHMAKRRSMLEINGRSTSSPEEESRDERQDRHRDHSSRREPERSLREPERSLREPERSLREPERSLREPERSLREPERSLREPERLLRDPERSLREPERLLREPERSLREPERSLREPERSHREPERSLRDIERSHRELERRKDDRILEREDSRELVHREIERLPRVGRPKRDEPKRYEYGNGDYMNRNEVKSLREDFDRYRERDRRDLERRVDDDEIIEPVIEERRRDWSDRQRVFSRARLIDDQRQGYEGSERERDRFFERDYRDFRDLAQRQPPAKFRHSYAEPLPRGRLAPVRPY